MKNPILKVLFHVVAFLGLMFTMQFTSMPLSQKSGTGVLLGMLIVAAYVIVWAFVTWIIKQLDF
jgi:hypothetical protein